MPARTIESLSPATEFQQVVGKSSEIHTTTIEHVSERSSSPEGYGQEVENYDIIVSGAGPAGLLLSVLLARNGITDPSSLLCVEPRLHVTAAGHADGLHARSLEMFKMLGLYEELMKVSTEVGERARWAETPANSSASGVKKPRMSRVMRQKVATAPNARMMQLISIAQGEIERILEADLKSNAADALLRGSRVVDSCIDETSTSHPVLVTIKNLADETTRYVRCKYLVGADGAHSTVRKGFGIQMEGESKDHVWGVLDFVVDTDFPDIRRLTTVQNSSGMAMCIPRETNAQGEWLTRFYVDINDLALERQKANAAQNESQTGNGVSTRSRQERSTISTEDILTRLRQIWAPFKMEMKKGTEIDWSTSYVIGQRVAAEFVKYDSCHNPRVFLVGDACHTHSPKLGQGMNVSMADSFNLAWKLTHALAGSAANSHSLLSSYATERRRIAQQLIELDARWYKIQWADEERKAQPGYQEECVKLYQAIGGFTSGCGIEYEESAVVVKSEDPAAGASPIISGTTENDHGATPYSGMVKPGKRLLNTNMLRLADGCRWDIHDNLIPDGARFKILVFCSQDILQRGGHSAKAVEAVFDHILPQFSSTLLDASVIAPEQVHAPDESSQAIALEDCDLWTSLPSCLKRDAEMKTYALPQKAYDTYGIGVGTGAVIVVRPDGIVGNVLALDSGVVDTDLKNFLGSVLV